MSQSVSVCIATHNMGHLIEETIANCMGQDYDNFKVIVYDDGSTDNTIKILDKLSHKYMRLIYRRGLEALGVGKAFNKTIEIAGEDYIDADIVILMCADDLCTNPHVISDIVAQFKDPGVVHVSRWYYQFVSGYPGPVRSWRGYNPILLANNPSGLAFRRSALKGCECSNKMFVETTQLVNQVLKKGQSRILEYDAIAVRVHQSTSTKPGYWKARKVSSAVLDQVGLGATEIATDFVSLIQIKRGLDTAAVIEEVKNFIKVKPSNRFNPRLWFWAAVAVLIPGSWAVKLPEFYRHRIGRLLTREIRRSGG